MSLYKTYRQDENEDLQTTYKVFSENKANMEIIMEEHREIKRTIIENKMRDWVMDKMQKT